MATFQFDAEIARCSLDGAETYNYREFSRYRHQQQRHLSHELDDDFSRISSTKKYLGNNGTEIFILGKKLCITR